MEEPDGKTAEEFQTRWNSCGAVKVVRYGDVFYYGRTSKGTQHISVIQNALKVPAPIIN